MNNDSTQDNIQKGYKGNQTHDNILYLIKSYAYERQEPEEGKLDGSFYILKGKIFLRKDVKFEKSIYPTYLKIERYRGIDNTVYYKTYVNKTDDSVALIHNYNNCEKHYFKHAMGSIFLIMNIFEKLQNQEFTIIIHGNSIAPLCLLLNTYNYEFIQSNLQLHVNNALTHFDNIYFELQQRYK